MTADEIRASFFRFKNRFANYRPNDREGQIYEMQMLVEVAAQLAEMNELLGRTLGILNAHGLVEPLILMLDRELRGERK
jgi:hypothetical protein